jgi:hypothetical protein
MGGIDNDRTQKPHQDVQDKKRVSSLIPLVMKMELFLCFIGHKKSHPKFPRRVKSFSILIGS